MPLVYVVTYEERDSLGRIVQEIDSLYVQESNAVARRKVINGDPVRFPGMVADVQDYPLMDGVIQQKRRYRGSIAKAQKINWEQAEQIRARHAAGETFRDIASSYGISAQTVSDVVHQLTWKSGQ